MQSSSIHSHFHNIPSSYSYYTPLLPTAPQNALLALRFPAFSLRYQLGFLFLKQLSSKLATEARVTLTLLIELIHDETGAGEPRPGWMRVLMMEIMCEYGSLYTFFRHAGLLATTRYVQAL